MTESLRAQRPTDSIHGVSPQGIYSLINLRELFSEDIDYNNK
ncbi:hypothetical protein [Moorena sp. SIO3H5]|nr:hypothetical protein [Moorena sp. SIO3H5]